MSVKKCHYCQQEKPVSEFSQQKRNKDGLGTRCRACCNAVAKVYYQKNKESITAKMKAYNGLPGKKDIDLRHRHGISLNDYKALLESQGGTCAICGGSAYGAEHYKHFAVDHDHTTGKIRGLLCNGCNIGLGKFKDNIVLLHNAIAYLERNK